MDSNHGSAIVTPAPRRNVRRETSWEPCFIALPAVDRFAEFINVSLVFRNASAQLPLEKSRLTPQLRPKRRVRNQYTPSTINRNAPTSDFLRRCLALCMQFTEPLWDKPYRPRVAN